MDNNISSTTKRLLQLSSLPGVGVVALRKIISRADILGLHSLENNDEIIASFARGSGSTNKTNESAWQSIIDACLNFSIRIISPLDPEYPKTLAHIEDFPPFLYVLGNISSLSMISSAVVGTRDASFLGLSWGRQIAEILVNYGFSIVSGLALGIDTAAHEGALQAKGTTVSILAHGLDKVTPASNKKLAERIVANGGTLVSEHPPGVPPRRPEYVRRNRIQSGLSVCSIVVESGESGGAIHQGNFTTRQGRRLYCVIPDDNVPGATEFRSAGGHRLMVEAGGIPIHNSQGLLKILESGILQNDYNRLISHTNAPTRSLL